MDARSPNPAARTRSTPADPRRIRKRRRSSRATTGSGNILADKRGWRDLLRHPAGLLVRRHVAVESRQGPAFRKRVLPLGLEPGLGAERLQLRDRVVEVVRHRDPVIDIVAAGDVRKVLDEEEPAPDVGDPARVGIRPDLLLLSLGLRDEHAAQDPDPGMPGIRSVVVPPEGPAAGALHPARGKAAPGIEGNDREAARGTERPVPE